MTVLNSADSVTTSLSIIQLKLPLESILTRLDATRMLDTVATVGRQSLKKNCHSLALTRCIHIVSSCWKLGGWKRAGSLLSVGQSTPNLHPTAARGAGIPGRASKAIEILCPGSRFLRWLATFNLRGRQQCRDARPINQARIWCLDPL